VVTSVVHLKGREVSLTDVLINATMLQDWFGVLRVDNVYWTLTIELSFYIVMAILFKTKMLKHIEILGLIWLVIMVWHIRIFLLMMDMHVPLWIKTTGLLRYGNLFFAGILFYNLKTKGNQWHRHVALFLCLCVQYIFREEINPLVVVGFFGLFYLFIYGKLTWLVNKPTVFLGTISYSLYLIHQNIGYVIINYLYSWHLNAWLIFIIPTISVIAIASAITFGIERPVMSFIRRTYKSWNKTSGDLIKA
jgi:peptidoglycan/LPS O-acetylase OafA/YrhL